jgi:hypothetical protein
LNEWYTDEARTTLSRLENREWVRAIAAIGLALVRKGELESVSAILDKAQLDPLLSHDDTACLRRVYLAHALATNDQTRVLTVFEKFSAYKRTLLACHFGHQERINFLLQCLSSNQLQLEKAEAGYPELKELCKQSEAAESE